MCFVSSRNLFIRPVGQPHHFLEIFFGAHLVAQKLLYVLVDAEFERKTRVFVCYPSLFTFFHNAGNANKDDNHAPQRRRVQLCRALTKAAAPTQSVLAEWLFASSSTSAPDISVSLLSSPSSTTTQESGFFFRHQSLQLFAVAVGARRRPGRR